ncbi:MAG TPA: hypothetical protein VEI03_07100 [Stellaceae bacterium]|nr:hypothetical protein [Stellaceae bacterium]
MADGVPSPSPLTVQEQIQILKFEYAALRTELLQRHTTAIQMATVFVTAAITIVTFSVTNAFWSWLVLLVVILPVIVGVVGLYFYVNMSYIVAQLIKLENQINDLANAKLLTWETDRAFFSDKGGERIDRIIGPFLVPFRRLGVWLKKKARSN